MFNLFLFEKFIKKEKSLFYAIVIASGKTLGFSFRPFLET